MSDLPRTDISLPSHVLLGTTRFLRKLIQKASGGLIMWAQHISWDRETGWNFPSSLRPSLIFVFGDRDHFAEPVHIRSISEFYPDSVVLGCSTGTVISNTQIVEDALIALAIGFENTPIRLATCDLSDVGTSERAGENIGAQLAADDLAAIFVLSDGLSVNGSELVRGLVRRVGEIPVLSGGLAADGDRFSRTLVAAGDAPKVNAVAAVGLYGKAIRVVHGSAGGWDEFGPSREITRSSGNVLFEIDNKPALDLYKRYLGDEAAGLPASGLFYPLSIWHPADPDNDVVRTLLSVDPDAGSMTLAGDVPQGWKARLMRGTIDRLIEGAEDAAGSAVAAARLGNIEPVVCLTVSCVGRRLLMGQRVQDEVEALAAVLGDRVAQIGFYSYGEIAPHEQTRICTLHNQTVTLTILGEAV